MFVDSKYDYRFPVPSGANNPRRKFVEHVFWSENRFYFRRRIYVVVRKCYSMHKMIPHIVGCSNSIKDPQYNITICFCNGSLCNTAMVNISASQFVYAVLLCLVLVVFYF